MVTLEYKKAETESERQEKNGLLVQNEIVYLFSYPMQELLEKGLIQYEDIENSYLTDEDIKDNYSYDLKDKSEEEINEFIQNIRDRGEDNKDIFEYWLVSNWLYEKLQELKEPVMEWNNLYIWGRCCTGQAIALDRTMDEVRKLLTKEL